MNLHFKRDFDQVRHEMVETAIVARGVRSELVLDAMRSVPREAFLPSNFANSPTKMLLCQSSKIRQFRSPTSSHS